MITVAGQPQTFLKGFFSFSWRNNDYNFYFMALGSYLNLSWSKTPKGENLHEGFALTWLKIWFHAKSGLYDYLNE